MSDKQVYARKVRNKMVLPNLDESKVVEIKFSRNDKINDYRSISEKLALHRIYMRNHVLKELKEAFPSKPNMWTVSKFFPHADSGVLYVDEPISDYEKKCSEEKKKVLNGKNFRFVVIHPTTTLEGAMEMLWQVDQERNERLNGLDNGD